MSWYKKIIIKNKKEIINGMLFVLVFSLVTLLWHFMSGKSFQWETISPIEAPSIFIRVFYSALVFVTFGRILFKIKFYKLLHEICVKELKDRQLFRGIKGIIWGLLILAMYYWVVPGVVNLLNAIISFFYNIFSLILYLFPPLGVSLVIFSIGYIIYKKSDKSFKGLKFLIAKK